MPKTKWSVRHAVARVHGCDVAVLWRSPDVWVRTVSVAGEQVASGGARSLQDAQDAAVKAAREHASRGGQIQLDLL